MTQSCDGKGSDKNAIILGAKNFVFDSTHDQIRFEAKRKGESGLFLNRPYRLELIHHRAG